MSAENADWIRTSLSIHPDVLSIGKANAIRRGFRHSFSAYVSFLIERDQQGAVEGGRLEPAPVRETPAPVLAASKAPKKPETVRDMSLRKARELKRSAN